MHILKNVIKLISILSILLIVNFDNIQEKKYEIKVNKTINTKSSINYLIINNYKLIIKSGNEKEILNSNYVLNMKNSTPNNIFLAGHNSKIVFNRIYYLQKKDLILLNYNKKRYFYEVYDTKYIKIDDKKIFKNENFNKLTLLTCCNNNQKRYIVLCKRKD